MSGIFRRAIIGGKILRYSFTLQGKTAQTCEGGGNYYYKNNSYCNCCQRQNKMMQSESLHPNLSMTVKGLETRSHRPIHTTSCRSASHDAEFTKAKERLSSLKEDPGNQVKLQIYALFKQATVGENKAKKPGMMDFVGKAKWEAWSSLGAITQDEAQLKYIELINGLVSTEETTPTSQSDGGQYKTLHVTNENGMYKIQLNRPNKKNAITVDMYNEWAAALAEADRDPSVVLATITGAGDYYCSGNDLNNFMGIDPKDMSKMAEDSSVLLQNFVGAFIDFSKPLIGVVNGPAVGVAVTTMGMFDLVYSTDKATFQTPFSSLGQSPEGCSSYLFPKILGPMKASEMLMFNKKISAQEACELGLVTEVFPDNTFQTEVWNRIHSYAKLPKGSLRFSKMLIRDQERDVLHRVNKAECERLVERWQSDECMTAIMNFFTKK